MNLCEGIKPTWPNRNLLSQRKRMNNKIHANSVGLLSMSDRAQTWHELKHTVTAVCNKRTQRMFHLFLYICLNLAASNPIWIPWRVSSQVILEHAILNYWTPIWEKHCCGRKGPSEHQGGEMEDSVCVNNYCFFAPCVLAVCLSSKRVSHCSQDSHDVSNMFSKGHVRAVKAQ